MQKKYLSTADFAEKVGKKPTTIYKSLWQHGSYLGVKPTRTPDRRLWWLESDAKRLLP